MSWSISCIGKPEAIVAYIEKYSTLQFGQCKEEFDDAAPHLIGLVRQNAVTEAGAKQGYLQTLIELEANGSGSTGPSGQLQRSCTVKIGQIWKNLV